MPLKTGTATHLDATQPIAGRQIRPGRYYSEVLSDDRIRNSSSQGYSTRIAQERSTYDNDLSVHTLPNIFHHWSDRYVRPNLSRFGLEEDKDLFKQYLETCCANGRMQPRRFVSLGSGNCDLEIELAQHLQAKGYGDFVIECLDLNQSMLDRGIAAAAEAGVRERLNFIQTDLNQWKSTAEYNAIIANQSLHHIVNLESVFHQIGASLSGSGYFLVSDIIGRNGHLRWPEALSIIQEFWTLLPPSYRYNHQLNRFEERFRDFDCSFEAFEGIRAQDILPLLLDSFHFSLFFGFANLIEPFIDRSFGPNFDAASEWDRQFIDAVAQRDELEIRSGRIKPTHLIAALCMRQSAGQLTRSNLAPELCVRRPQDHMAEPIPTTNVYQCDSDQATSQRELERVCQRLKHLSEHSERLTAHVGELEERVSARTAWAKGLDVELEKMTELLAERTAWAQGLDVEVQRLTDQLAELTRELEERTAWALEAYGPLKALKWARRLYRWARRSSAKPDSPKQA